MRCLIAVTAPLCVLGQIAAKSIQLPAYAGVTPNGCGTHGGGCQRCANVPSKQCCDCGYEPCVDVNNMCWSCWGADNKCYPYACSSGQHCGVRPCTGGENETVVARYDPNFSANPQTSAVGPLALGESHTAVAATSSDASALSWESAQHTQLPVHAGSPPNGCGTHGGGCQKCANVPSKQCCDCGYEPCVDVNNMCWSCWGADNKCYPYACSSGQHCGVSPCAGGMGNETVVARFFPMSGAALGSPVKSASSVTAGQLAAKDQVAIHI